MINKNFSLSRLIVYCSISILIALQSCDKTRDTSGEIGEATVMVSLAGVEYDDTPEEVTLAKNTLANGQTKMSGNMASSHGEEEPFAVVPFDENHAIYATLKQERNTPNQRVLSASSGNKGAIVRTQLTNGVRYRLLVFGPTGTYVDQRDYVYGSEASTAALNLDGGTTYTFVAYSFNTTAAIPALNLTTTSTLANTSLTNLTGDFLYFKNTVQVVMGNNNLSVVLKHMFSEVTTVLTVGSTTGPIQGFTTPTITPTNPSASIQLNTNTMSYANSTGGTGINFTAVGTGATSTTSTPAILISPATTTAAFTFGTLTINGITRSNISIPAVKINPGRKYTLTLSINSSCTQSTLVSPTSPNFDLTGGAGITFTTQAVAANLRQEFVLDFYELDNSFNLLFNGLNIVNSGSTTTPTEIQFESGSSSMPRNIEFADGTFWGSGGIPNIWTLRVGTPSNNPIIRVVIDRNGTITMYGIKANGGQLLPLRLTGGLTFRQIPWRTTGSSNNTVALGQSNVAPPTLMRGAVSARRNCQ
ncbi:hypothetical protein PQ465_11915 [Sphingobacterium oryzagri]|uniref:Fimbrillin family protein n=1 Tax=Sphingobacterium oryzagri TaxID=3025669 RepID=A0ABY7WBH5_9SPHI|nr:hypothetical protein [Sphingobacterium sp. KACC 22765]WDF67012.1 hypothetical protein PQ465_11915 [Sphingobacterium sp. KACC 22765]